MNFHRQSPGFLFSSAAHAVVLVYAIVGISSKPFEVGPSEALPVEIVSPEEFDQLTKGLRTSKVVAPPKVQATKVAEAQPEAKPDLPEARRDVEPPPPPPSPEPRRAEATPEPPKPEPKHEPPKWAEAPPMPVPKPPDVKVAEAPKREPPKPEKPAVDPIKAELEKTRDLKPTPKPPEPKPRRTAEAPKPPPSDRREPARHFDPTKIAALVDRRDPGRTATAAPQLASASTAGIATGTASRLSLSERRMIDGRIRDAVASCWNPPIGAAGAQDLQVRVRFSLAPDGAVSGNPAVVNRGSSPYFQAAADSATRAVRRCAPIRDLPQASYDYWKEVEITFDPRDMMGG